ncbi:hypothetical protein BS47DRAFT_1394146 [Hydnum rufescens UP504]|uniref:Uncharacterized protein n=1 Tax=Hydnum rufescens UP504 TaxID=1448309 RepID=A0A9P6AWA3_9AGAM|nr:hypothetical protein BS47DRAFT_1394146 [Hydnum rufescens UP504]
MHRPPSLTLSGRLYPPTFLRIRRTIKSHSRTYENAVRDDGDAFERERQRERGGGHETGWNPGFFLSSPRQLVQYLDKYVVGQDRAKKVLSVAVFNHYNRVRAKMQTLMSLEEEATAGSSSTQWDGHTFEPDGADPPPHLDLRPHPNRRQSSNSNPHRGSASHSPLLTNAMAPIFDKSNVLLMGPTGSGKTLLARTLARVLDVPFAMSDATTLTQAGYVGEDVEMVVHRLLQASNWTSGVLGVWANSSSNTLRLISTAFSIGIIVLDEADKLARRSSPSSDSSRDVSGEGVQQGLLRMLEGSVVNVNAKGVEGGGGSDIVGPSSGGAPGSVGAGNIGAGRGRKGPLGGIVSPPSGPKSDTYQVDTTDVLFILSGAFVGLDKVVQSRLAKGSIGFGAALASDAFSIGQTHGASSMPFFTRNSEMKEINPYELVEPVDLIKYGFIPEFTSRIPTITALNPLTTSDLMRVLTEVRGSLAKQYEALFGYSGVEIRFTTPALREICEMTVKRGMGARGLRGIMEGLLLESMYDVPGSSVRYVLVDLAVVQARRPASYWSRGEQHAFYGALAAEEEMDAKQRAANKTDNNPDMESESVEKESKQEKKARMRSSGGSGFP